LRVPHSARWGREEIHLVITEHESVPILTTEQLVDHPKILLLKRGGEAMGVRASRAEGGREPSASKQRNVGLRNLVWCLNPLKADHVQIVIDTCREDSVLLSGFVEEVIAIDVECTKNNLHVVFRESQRQVAKVIWSHPPVRGGGSIDESALF
jgi:hypothetical protein